NTVCNSSNTAGECSKTSKQHTVSPGNQSSCSSHFISSEQPAEHNADNSEVGNCFMIENICFQTLQKEGFCLKSHAGICADNTKSSKIYNSSILLFSRQYSWGNHIPEKAQTGCYKGKHYN